MPRTIQRDGLSQALGDFGVDSAPQVATLGDFVIPTIQLQDLTLNYEPALRARVSLYCAAPAGGANFHSGVSIQADMGGFWLLAAQHLSSTGLSVVWVMEAPVTFAVPLPIGGNSVGSSPGQAIVGDVNTPAFFRSALQGAWDPILPGLAPINYAGWVLDPRMAHVTRPIWVPGNCYLHAFQNAANAAAVISLDIQVPAVSTGFWP